MSWILFWACISSYTPWSKDLHLLCRLPQTFCLPDESQPERDELLYSAPSKDSQSSASLQLLMSQTVHGFAKIERKPPVYHKWNNTVRLLHSLTSSSARSAEASLFGGHDKGPALGKIIFYCDRKSVQWAGQGSEDAAVAECRLVSRWNPERSDSDPNSVVCVLQPPCCWYTFICITQCLLIQIISIKWY